MLCVGRKTQRCKTASQFPADNSAGNCDAVHKKQNSCDHSQLSLFAVQSDSTLDLVGTQASCTDVYMARSTVNNSFYALDVGLPSSVGTSMRVRDLDTESHTLAADIALCHLLHLLAITDFLRRPKDAPTS